MDSARGPARCQPAQGVELAREFLGEKADIAARLDETQHQREHPSPGGSTSARVEAWRVDDLVELGELRALRRTTGIKLNRQRVSGTRVSRSGPGFGPRPGPRAPAHTLGLGSRFELRPRFSADVQTLDLRLVSGFGLRRSGQGPRVGLRPRGRAQTRAWGLGLGWALCRGSGPCA